VRQVKPLDVKYFMNECCTRVLMNGVSLITHRVDGRLIKSVASAVSAGRDFFIIKLNNTLLIQRYIVVIREMNKLGLGTNIMAYFSELEGAESYLEGK
jgi:hypothetical protein